MAAELNETTETVHVTADGPQLVARLAACDGAHAEMAARAGAGGWAVVAPPHPLMGGSLDNPVVEALARGLYAAGLRTLRFNWRGVGASTGAPSGDLTDGVADYHATLARAAAIAAGDDPGTGSDAGAAAHADPATRPALVAAGYSFGAVAAVLVGLADARVTALTLVAPPLAMVELPELASLTAPVHVVVGEHDELAPIARIEARLATLPDARLDVVAGADHFFSVADPAALAMLVEAGAVARTEPSAR